MIQGIIGKKLFDYVVKKLMKDFDLPRINRYVVNENDADKRINSLELEVEKLKINNHAPSFSDSDKNDIIRRLVNLENFKKRRI